MSGKGFFLKLYFNLILFYFAMMIFLRLFFNEWDETIKKAHDWGSNPTIFKDFYCFFMHRRP